MADTLNELQYCVAEKECTDYTDNGVNGKVSTDNSTSETLGASATYTGTWEDISEFASISIVGTSTNNVTLYYDFSTDASTTIREVQLSAGTDNTLGIHSLIPIAQYGRVRVVDAGSGADIVMSLLPPF